MCGTMSNIILAANIYVAVINLGMNPQLCKKNSIYFLSMKIIRILTLILTCQPKIQSSLLIRFNLSVIVLRSLCPMLCQELEQALLFVWTWSIFVTAEKPLVLPITIACNPGVLICLRHGNL